MPNADAGGPYATSEGVVTTLDGTSSSPGSHASTGSLSYAWDLDNDGEYDDAVSATPTFAHVGQDGVASVGLRVTNAAGVVDTDAATISVANVVPVVDLDLVATVAEGGTITVNGSGSDPGWLDVLTATIDWDDGSGLQALAGTPDRSDHVVGNARNDHDRLHADRKLAEGFRVAVPGGTPERRPLHS